jgi:AraC-like DNA-binding protein
MHVSVAIVRALADWLLQLGVSTDAYCAAAGLDAARLADPTAMVSIGEYGRLLASARSLSGDPAFALRAGERARTGALHTLGYLLLNCTTMRDAIGEFTAHAALIYEEATWELRETGDRAVFSYDHPAVGDDLAAPDAEFCLAHIVAIGRHFSGRALAPREVHLRHREPRHAGVYEQVFQCRVLFERPRNEVVFKRALLDVPHIHRDESVAQLLRQRAEALLAERQSDAHLKQRIIDLVKYRPDLEPVDAEAVARLLGVGPRTLRRRLASLDLSLFTIIEQARTELACEALAGSAPIKEIADRLGFSEVSAFHRAFKRWTGLTPGQFRNGRRDRESRLPISSR